MRTLLRLLCCLPLLLACRGTSAAEAPAPVAPSAHPLASLAGQRVVVAPAFRVREGDPMGWAAQIPRSREFLRSLDTAIVTELGERGLEKQWVYPADLARSARRSPTYAVDPYALAMEPLRNPNVGPGAKIGDPLATQIRTMIALHDARFVLLPTEVRFERDKAGQGIALLRVVLLDGRIGDVRWAGDVATDPSPAFSRALLASLAGRFADLITSR